MVRPLDLVAVKGQEVGNYIYELIDFQNEATRKTIELVEEYEAALTTYIDSHFQEAAKKFESITKHFPDDGPAKLLLKRCLHLCEHPPLKWDGIHRMSFK